MDTTFHLHIATPEKDFFAGPVESLVLTTTDGEVGVLPGHSSMVAALAAAPMRIKPQGEDWRTAAVIGGFARVMPEYVIVFSDTAEWPEDIEESRALEAKRRAEERLQAKLSEMEYLRSRVALERALVRLTVKSGQKYD